MSDRSHADEITKQPTESGWVKTTTSDAALRFFPFLSSVRNRVFKPLEALTKVSEEFDAILFLNVVVVYRTDDVLRLLDTNGGSYAAAYALDFSNPPAFYDTFALRDEGRHEAVMST